MSHYYQFRFGHWAILAGNVRLVMERVRHNRYVISDMRGAVLYEAPTLAAAKSWIDRTFA